MSHLVGRLMSHPRNGGIMNVKEGAVDGAMKFRFVSWNVNWKATAIQRRGQSEFVRRLAPDPWLSRR